METFSFNTPTNLIEEGNWLLGVTPFECTSYVFNKTDENNSFSISSPSYWTPQHGEELINKINKFLQLRSENDIKLHAKKLKKEAIEKKRKQWLLFNKF